MYFTDSKNCPCTFDFVSMDLLHLCVQWGMEWWKL